MKKYDWVLKGLLLGFTFFVAALLVKPIGVSTQFTVLSGKLYGALVQGAGFEFPWNYNYIFVLAIPLGAYAASLLLNRDGRDLQSGHIDNGVAGWKQFFGGFAGGLLLLYGARMADGCTSGHMMSGISQGSLSGIVFAATVFAVAVPTAILAKKYLSGGN